MWNASLTKIAVCSCENSDARQCARYRIAYCGIRLYSGYLKWDSKNVM